MPNVQAGFVPPYPGFQYGPMSGNSGGGRIGGAAAPTQSTSTSSQQSSGGSYWQNPNQINSLAGSLMAPIQEASANYMNFINNPAQHPIFQNSLSGLMAALIPSEQLGQRNLNDAFRAAGNTSSSTFADAARNYQGDVLRNRQTLASNLLTSLFPQVAQAMQAPMSMTSPLIDALKLTQQQSSGSSESSSGPADGSNEKNGHLFTTLRMG